MNFDWLPTALLWVGIGLALLATVVVAPAAPGDLWRMLTRPRGQVHTSSGASWPIESSVRAAGDLDRWNSSADDATKIEMLRANVLDLRQRVLDSAAEIRTEYNDRIKRLSERLSKLEAELDGIRNETNQAREKSQALDAKGFPLIGLGIVISGAPEKLGANECIGLPVLVLGVVAMGVGAWLLVTHTR